MHKPILKSTSGTDHDFILLSSELDTYLNEIVGGEKNRKSYLKYNKTDTMDHVVIAYINGVPVGCAALRAYQGPQIEVKRVFVREPYRKLNIGGILLENLIQWAQHANYAYMLLETGSFLADSIKLYKRYGFWQIKNYGDYRDMPASLCMGRSLLSSSITYHLKKKLTTTEIAALFQSVDWLSGNYPEQLEKGFQNAGTVISAIYKNKLVGLVEVLDDGCAVAYVHYLLVHPAFQNREIGTQLMQYVKEIYASYISLIVIAEKPKLIPFYNRLGFNISEGATPLDISCF